MIQVWKPSISPLVLEFWAVSLVAHDTSSYARNIAQKCLPDRGHSKCWKEPPEKSVRFILCHLRFDIHPLSSGQVQCVMRDMRPGRALIPLVGFVRAAMG